jgi:hypothetical protein
MYACILYAVAEKKFAIEDHKKKVKECARAYAYHCRNKGVQKSF